MPPIFLHMAVARDVSAELPARLREQDAGTYLFGATSPDIRVIARWERERTHFFNLDNFEHQDSVANFFAANPNLLAPERLAPATVAFVSGYITHLALDETWIGKVYRPYFGQLSSLGGGMTADTMDRILQFELDRRRRVEPGLKAEIEAALKNSSVNVDVGFLDSEILQRWLEVATDQAHYPGDWERFRYQASRHLRARGIETEQDWEQFRQEIPDLLKRTITHVSTAEVDAFTEEGKERALDAVRQYLGA